MKPYYFAMPGLAEMLLAVLVSPGVEASARADDNLQDPARFVFFTDISWSEAKGLQGCLHDRFNNKTTRLRVAPGADAFQVKTAEGMVTVSGRVVHMSMDEREMVFQAGDKYYVVRLGQSVKDALREPLSKERVKELKLPPPR